MVVFLRPRPVGGPEEAARAPELQDQALQAVPRAPLLPLRGPLPVRARPSKAPATTRRALLGPTADERGARADAGGGAAAEPEAEQEEAEVVAGGVVRQGQAAARVLRDHVGPRGRQKGQEAGQEAAQV
jgi:hypothetical protein